MDNLLIKQPEKYDKIVRLEGLIKSNSDPRELKRGLAVKMSIEGYSARIVAQLLSVNTSFVRDWKRAFKVGGIAGIKLGYQGAIGKLTTEQRREIIEWLKAKDYWHLDELINHLEDRYEVVHKSKQSYYDLFEAGKIRWKRSQKVNPQFDEELVKKSELRLMIFWLKTR